MVKYILKRIGFLLLTLFIVASATFFLMKLLPGTPFNNPKIPADQLLILKKQYGLDKPVWMQYLTYIVGISHGDFGMSLSISWPNRVKLNRFSDWTISTNWRTGDGRRHTCRDLAWCHCRDPQEHMG